VIAVADRIANLAQAVPSALAKVALFRAWAHGMSGDAVSGLVEFEAGLMRQREIATSEGVPVYESMRAELFERAGRHDEALSNLDGAIAASVRSGQVFYLPELLRQRARVRHTRHEPEEAVAQDLRRALEVATEQHAAALVARVRQDLERLGLETQARGA
jgi:hypothetical protein